MALKRLDEEFDLKPGTQLLPYMKRLLPSLEGRFQSLEAERKTFDMAVEDMRAVALQRINEILIPATEDIIETTSLGFMLGPSTSSVLLELGVKVFTIIEGPQRETFTPSPYVIVERSANIDDYAIARVQYYTRETGALSLYITAVHGDPGPWNDWVISSTPGMADSTKLYHDAVAPMHDQVVADTATVLEAKDEVLAAAAALEAAGLDAQAFVRRDGAVPFIALQAGVHPAQGANDSYLATTFWARARMIEYATGKVNRSGDTMAGPLLLPAPTAPQHAANKAYIDNLMGTIGTFSTAITISMVQPSLVLRSTGSGQHRLIAGQAPSSATRWLMSLGDTTLESGGDTGSDFVLYRYNDGGGYLGSALHIARQTAVVTTYNTLNVSTGGASITGNLNNAGDFWSYRADNTGVLWMGNQRSARIYWNGSTWDFNAGGISCGGGPLTGGHLNCYSISTQGYGITTWGLTSHGSETINGHSWINGVLHVNSGGSAFIHMDDSDWGRMSIHHNGDTIGFLNNGGGWCGYFTNAGHVWTAQYGWLHDYVNNTASNQAWYAANYRYGQVVTETRWAFAGTIFVLDYANQSTEPWFGAALTGVVIYYDGRTSHYHGRYMQVAIGGGWYTTRYE